MGQLSRFKQQVVKDAKQVFLNEKEFAERHNINGEDVLCIIDRNINSQYQDSAAYPIDGVFINTLTIYVLEEMEIPAVDSVLSVDGSFHKVLSASAESGIIMIVVQENVS